MDRKSVDQRIVKFVRTCGLSLSAASSNFNQSSIRWNNDSVESADGDMTPEASPYRSRRAVSSIFNSSNGEESDFADIRFVQFDRMNYFPRRALRGSLVRLGWMLTAVIIAGENWFATRMPPPNGFPRRVLRISKQKQCGTMLHIVNSRREASCQIVCSPISGQLSFAFILKIGDRISIVLTREPL